MDSITDQIAIGNFKDAAAPSHEVDHILCLIEDCCEDRDQAVTNVPLIDGPGNDEDDVKKAVGALRDAVTAGEKILVHCHAGRSRSVCIVAAHLVLEQGMSRVEAFAAIRARRDVQMAPGVMEILDLAGCP